MKVSELIAKLQEMPQDADVEIMRECKGCSALYWDETKSMSATSKALGSNTVFIESITTSEACIECVEYVEGTENYCECGGIGCIPCNEGWKK